MSQKVFGGAHTIEKLERLETYLRAFLTAFKNMNWAHTVYFDAFAGTGEVPLPNRNTELPLDEAEQTFIAGSASRALGLELEFGEYIFVEKNRNKAAALKSKLHREYPHRAHLIDVRTADANDALVGLCASRDWTKCRAVVFLDPFGSQVVWSTIESIAATKAIDLWYLFPAGLSVHRQIGKDGTVHYTHEASITRLLGTDQWRDAFLETQQAEPDLFGQMGPSVLKTATPEAVTHFMIKRMKSEFGEGVLEDYLPLGRNQGHWYSLVFACANPSKKARSLALKLARAVIKGSKRGRSK